MRKISLFACCVVLCVATTQTAFGDELVAEDSVADDVAFSLGVRVGGYGFREVDDGRVNWDDCQMHGIGIFTALDLPSVFYVEASVDVYNAVGRTLEEGLDRTSVHGHLSLGARFFEDSWITPAIHIGGGPEYSVLKFDGTTQHAILPNGFFGAGAELNLGSVKLGSHLRVIGSGVPEEPYSNGDNRFRPIDSSELEFRVGGQVQFWARYMF